MTFEQFVREFAEWFSQKRPAAMMIGIRAVSPTTVLSPSPV
ncbi:hypothetical protein ACVXHA_22625 [Escherichia coli]